MSKKIQKPLEDALQALKDLESLLDERIVENNTIACQQSVLAKQFTHCFMFYRSHIWDAQNKIKEALNNVNN